MPIDWWSRDQLPFTLMIILGFLGFILSQAGYYLGWWNDGHEMSGVITAVMFVLGLVATASRKQVKALRSEVHEARGDIVRRQDAQLRRQDDQLRRQDEQTGLLRQIRDRLPPRPASQP